MTTLSVLRFSLNTLGRHSFTKLSPVNTVNQLKFSRCLASSLFNNPYKCQRNHTEKDSLPRLQHVRFLGTSDKNFADGIKTPEQKKIEEDIFEESSKLGLFARFKLMYKKYWYVLIPVHCVTSVGWLAGFYYLSKRWVYFIILLFDCQNVSFSGVDVPSLLQYIHLSENIIEKVKGSELGHLAIAYLCYKVATPVRYAVTLGGTTVSIKYLVKSGHIKPVPTKEQFMKMYEDKKSDLKHKHNK